MSEPFMVIPVERDTIILEYADGDLAVRIKIAADDVHAFWEAFADIDTAAFLANGHGAIECVRGPVCKEFADGALAVKILIHPAQKARFRELWPKPKSAAVLAREDPTMGRSQLQAAAIAANPLPAYGEHARQLRVHLKFMNNPAVWEAVGTDEDYQKWLRTLPCAHCKWVPHWEMDHFVPCESAHVRRVASGSGTSIKPRYSAIPLCPPGHGKSCHRAQHQQGESYLGGKGVVDKLRLHYVNSWVWETLKARLGYEHWNCVGPKVLTTWASEHGLLDCLPKIYLENP